MIKLLIQIIYSIKRKATICFEVYEHEMGYKEN